jgi:hypothetical protein
MMGHMGHTNRIYLDISFIYGIYSDYSETHGSFMGYSGIYTPIPVLGYTKNTY